MEHLTRTPISLSAEWCSKTITTDPPRLTEHLEWAAAFTLRAPSPIRVVALLERGSEMHWGLDWDDAAPEVELVAAFSPWAWRTSESVQVNFAGRRTRVTDSALKQDARRVATIPAPSLAGTGEFTGLLSLPAHGITLGFIAFALEDTEERRLGRWRVRPDAAALLPERFAPFASGYQSGTLVAGS